MTARLRASRLRAGHRDDGITLSELLVSMMIFTIVLAVATSVFVATTRQSRATQGKVGTQSDSRTLMESITRDLRVTVPNPNGGIGLDSGTDSSVTVYTARGGNSLGPAKVSYAVDPSSGCMRRTSIAPAYVSGVLTYQPANAKTRCVVFATVNTSTPVFTYNTIGTGGVLGTATMPADRDKVGSVTVNLSLTSPNQPEATPTVVNRTVTLFNQSTTIQKGL